MSRIDRSYNARPTRLTQADIARQHKALEELARSQRQAKYWRWAQRTFAALLGLGIAAILFYRF